MSNDWARKFQQKRQEQDLAKQETAKNFRVYQETVHSLFELIERKVRDVPEIGSSRCMGAKTAQFRDGITGPFTIIKNLVLKCGKQSLEFEPEGVNFENCHGRIRIRHTSRRLHQFVHLHLVKDPASTLPYPQNLHWTFTDGDAVENTQPVLFDEKQIEFLLEAGFLNQ